MYKYLYQHTNSEILFVTKSLYYIFCTSSKENLIFDKNIIKILLVLINHTQNIYYI